MAVVDADYSRRIMGRWDDKIDRRLDVDSGGGGGRKSS